MTKRLTEEDVHLACTDIASQGERPTSLNLLERLGRGSLTTISKYLTSWNQSDDALAIEAESLPAIVQLPDELSANGEDLLKKMWSIAKGIADQELDIQREALKQAEMANQAKVEEAFKFSEAQSMKIERLEEDMIMLKGQLDKEFVVHKEARDALSEADKNNIGLCKDNEQAQQEIEVLKEKITSLDTANEKAGEDNKSLERECNKVVASKDKEIRSLDILANNHRVSLDSSIQINHELTLKIKEKSSKLDACIIDIEKTKVRYETASFVLKETKNELIIAHKAVSEGEKRTAKLEGQLSVYKKIQPTEK